MVLLREARTQSDGDLIAASAAGDEASFFALIDRHKDRLHTVVYRYLGNTEDAAEVCQDACLRAYRALPAFRGDAAFATWLTGIALNLARNRLRDRSRKGRNMGTSLDALDATAPGLIHQAQGPGASPADTLMEAETAAALQECLDELDEGLRAAFVLRVFDGMNYQDIAAALGIPVGTVKSRLNGARQFLRTRLRERSVI